METCVGGTVDRKGTKQVITELSLKQVRATTRQVRYG